MTVQIHKHPDGRAKPLVSIVLLDWSVREYYQALQFLNDQDVPRELYELIWVELYDRVAPEAMQHADWVITCNQQGIYHKHVGYNVGLLHARGEVVTVCDSDAVFPREFVSSILAAFPNSEPSAHSLVLMHYQWRTSSPYPQDGVLSLDKISSYKWAELWPNVGACMSVRKRDAIRFGGFDEHRTLRGYWCGPYDLGWRMVNAGIPEVWQDSTVALWHFAHTNPSAEFLVKSTRKQRREKAYPHADYHAYTAMEAFASGRLLPLEENAEIFARRMAGRRIGTEYERRLAAKAGPNGFGALYFLKQYYQQFLKPEINLRKTLADLRFKLGLGARLRALLGSSGRKGAQAAHSQPVAEESNK